MAVTTTSIGILIITFGIVAGGYVPFVFFPKGESNWIIAEISYPLGIPFKTTEKTVSPYFSRLRSVSSDFKKT